MDDVLGVSIERYAAVQAATAEGIPVDTALAQAGIDARSWLEIDEAWQERIFEDEERDGLLLEAYDAHLVAAQDRYARAIPPIDEDLRAWLHFVRIMSDEADVAEFLGRFDLSTTDVLRLHRAWARRLEKEPELQREALSAMQERPREMPIPRPAPRAFVAAPALPLTTSPQASGDDAARPLPPLSTAFPGKVKQRHPPAGIDTRPAAPPTPAPAPAPAYEPRPPFAPVQPRVAARPSTPPLAPAPALVAMQNVPSGTVVLPPTPATQPRPIAAHAAASRGRPAPSRDAVPSGTVDMDQSQFPSLAAAVRASPAAGRAPAASSVPTPSLTLEQYAAMTAELLVGKAALVYTKYGQENPEARQAMVAAWDDRLRKNPAEYAEWNRIYLATLKKLGIG